MKVLGIVCSPRKEGNTEILVKEALASAHEAGAQTELFRVADKTIAPCDGCGSCFETDMCKIEDDMQPLYHQMESAAHGTFPLWKRLGVWAQILSKCCNGFRDSFLCCITQLKGL